MADKEFSRLDMEGADVWYCESYIDNANSVFDCIDKEVQWSNFPVSIGGRSIASPRWNFYMGDSGALSFRYTGFTRLPSEWTPNVEKLRNEMQDVVRKIRPDHPLINAVLGNRYDDGKHYIGFHQDDERDLQKDAFIVSVSLGATRDFIFKSVHTNKKIVIPLERGSVICMGGETQKNWKHGVPKRLRVSEPRINLTFRSIVDRI